MLQKTGGIVLKKTKYSETSLIVRIFTEEFGLQSFLVQGVRSRKSKIKANLFEAFSPLDLVVYFKEKNSLHRVKEVKPAFVLQSLPFDLAKSSIALFLSDLLCKTLKEGEPDPGMYQLLNNAIGILDLEPRANPHFHLLLMTKLARYFGFPPDVSTNSELPVFDLNEGTFSATKPDHNYFLAGELKDALTVLLGTNFDQIHGLNLPKSTRQDLLEKLIVFYQIHTDHPWTIKSHQILQEIVNS